MLAVNYFKLHEESGENKLRIAAPSRVDMAHHVSFSSQRFHRIDPRRTTGGNEAREGCHREQYKRRHSNDRDKVGLETVEQHSQEARHDNRQDRSDGKAGERQLQAASAKAEQYVPRSRPQRHTHADLVDALGYGVGEYSV